MDNSPRQPRWWLIGTAAILAIVTLYYYTGSWLIVVLFFIGGGLLLAFNVRREKRRSPHACLRCGIRMHANAIPAEVRVGR